MKSDTNWLKIVGVCMITLYLLGIGYLLTLLKGY